MTDSPQKADLVKLRRLLSRMTGGTWVFQTSCSFNRIGVDDPDSRDGCVASAEKHVDGMLSIRIHEADGEGIVYLRNVAEDLLNRLETAEAMLKRFACELYYRGAG